MPIMRLDESHSCISGQISRNRKFRLSVFVLVSALNVKHFRNF